MLCPTSGLLRGLLCAGAERLCAVHAHGGGRMGAAAICATAACARGPARPPGCLRCRRAVAVEDIVPRRGVVPARETVGACCYIQGAWADSADGASATSAEQRGESLHRALGRQRRPRLATGLERLRSSKAAALQPAARGWLWWSSAAASAAATTNCGAGPRYATRGCHRATAGAGIWSAGRVAREGITTTQARNTTGQRRWRSPRAAA